MGQVALVEIECAMEGTVGRDFGLAMGGAWKIECDMSTWGMRRSHSVSGNFESQVARPEQK